MGAHLREQLDQIGLGDLRSAEFVGFFEFAGADVGADDEVVGVFADAGLEYTAERPDPFGCLVAAHVL